MISGKGLASHELTDSDGAQGVLPKNGAYELAITRWKHKVQSDGGHGINLTTVVQDDEEQTAADGTKVRTKGTVIYLYRNVTGSYTFEDNGTQKEVQRVVFLKDLAIALGKEGLVKEIEEKAFDLLGFMSKLTGYPQDTVIPVGKANFAGNIVRRKDDPDQCEVKNLLRRAKYEELRTAGTSAFRSDPKPARRRAGRSEEATSSNSAGSAAGNSTAAADAMSAEV